MILYKLGHNGMQAWEGHQNGSLITISHGLLSGKRQIETLPFPTEHDAEKELLRRFNKKKDREGYTEEVPGEIPDLPMLAVNYDDFNHYLPKEVMVQRKLDGIRCIATRDGMKTRRNEYITSMPHVNKALKSLPPGTKLDGELYCHGMSFQEHLSLIKRDVPLNEGLNKVRYYVFDMIADKPFSDRYNDYLYICDSIGDPLIPVMAVKKYQSEIDSYLTTMINQGYEGVMIRSPSGHYEANKRSKYLQKLKCFDMEEYKVLDIVTAERGREAGAALYVCATKDGKEFRVRPKMSLPKRTAVYQNREKLIGWWTRVRYQGLTKDGKPRQPIAEGLEATREQLNG